MTNKNSFKIKVSKNGPYIVTGGVPLYKQTIIRDNNGDPLSWKTTKEYPVTDCYYLCRCGHSKNKPFCDKSHLDTKFDGNETAGFEPYAKKAKRFTGPELDLTDYQEICSSAGFCHRQGGTRELVKKSDDPKAKKTAITQCNNCPSGRLIAWDKKGNSLDQKFEPGIYICEDPKFDGAGPIIVRGKIPIESADGKPYEIRNRVALCRCGESSNKPLCDGSHLS